MNCFELSITSKRLYCTVIVTVTVSLCLVLLGMKVPNLSRLHSPKPRPRAVIENSVKVSHHQGYGTAESLDLEACRITLVPPAPLLSSAAFRPEVPAARLAPIKHYTARAPPFDRLITAIPRPSSVCAS